MEKDDIILASLPISNGSYKIRPALILSFFPPYGDYLVCGISSKLHQNIKEVSFLISEKDSFFKSSGLQTSSIVRLNYIAAIPENIIAGKIGSIPKVIYNTILNKFITLIQS